MSRELRPVGQTIEVQDEVASELALTEAAAAVAGGRFEDALSALDAAGVQGPVADYYRGVALAGLERWDQAIEILRSVQNAPGAPAEVELDLGAALLRSGDLEAAESVLARYVEQHPNDPCGQYLLGLALYRQGETEAALDRMNAAAAGDGAFAPLRDAFEQTVAGAPPVPMQPLAYDVPPPRRWNLTFLTGYEYDTNVSLAPEFSGLGAGADRDDSRWIAGLFGDYRLIQEENWNVGLIGSAFGGFQFDLDQFDVQNYMGGIYTNAAFGNWLFGTNYRFFETLLDEEQFLMNHRLVLSGTYLEGAFGHTTGYYEFEHLDFDGLALIPAQDRSGDIHWVGVTQAVYLMNGAGRLFGEYRFGDANADGSDFDGQIHMVGSRVEVPLAFDRVGWMPGNRWFSGTVADADVRYFWENYDNPNSLDFFERPREDNRVEVRAGIQKYFDEHVSLRFDYTFIDSDSNVANLFDVGFFTFDRHIFSSQFIYDF